METIKNQCQDFLKRHKWPILAILAFLIFSYLIISSDYNHVFADAGFYAKSAKIFHETNKLDTSGAAPALIGQLLFSNLLTKIFGFRLKILHISVYLVSFFYLIAMYLLLYEFGINRFLALFGSLTLLINPISIKMIDWYLSEPFFMFYFIFSLLFFIKGLRRENCIYIYIGGIFCSLAILTRQYAVSLSMALIFLCIIYRKKMKREISIHCIISSLIPIIAIGLFYLCLFSGKIVQSDVPFAYTSAKAIIFNSLKNPFRMLSRFYFDSLFFLHYTTLYLFPLFIILIVSTLTNPKKIKTLFSNYILSLFCILYTSIGTIYLYIGAKRSMPYLSSIFSIGYFRRFLKFSATATNNASLILTIFTCIGAAIILIQISDYFVGHEKVHCFSSNENNKDKKKKKLKQKNKKLKQPDNKIDFGKKLFYWWGIIYILLTSLLVLRYDRYIFPFTILMIYVVLSHSLYLEKQKKTFIIIFILVFLLVFPDVISKNLGQDLQWETCNYLLSEGIPSYKINGSFTFNAFHSFDYITNLYEKVKIKRPINWYKFHPLAHYFVTSAVGLENKQSGLILYKSFHKNRLFGFYEKKCFIYKRKEGYSKAIWI